MDDSLLATLQRAGLTLIEAKVYVTLVERGQMLAGDIAKTAGIHRRLVYDATERLIAKGLVGHVTRNNRTLYEAAAPERLVELQEESRHEVDSAVKALKSRRNVEKAGRQVLVFDGKAGLKSVFEDQLAVGEEILIVSSGAESYRQLQHYFHWFDERRKKAGIRVKVIFEKEARGKIPKIPLAQVRFLSKEHIGPAAINIYGDNVCLVSWEEKPLAVLMRDRHTAEGYRKFFSLLWQTAA
jgi:sugar-specific transcriptional regulator TrmB